MKIDGVDFVCLFMPVVTEAAGGPAGRLQSFPSWPL